MRDITKILTFTSFSKTTEPSCLDPTCSQAAPPECTLLGYTKRADNNKRKHKVST